MRVVAKGVHQAYPGLDRSTIRALVQVLWSKPVHERRLAAIEILTFYKDVLDARDMRLIERLIREAKSWAYVDALAVGVAGRLVERFPELSKTLDRWSTDEDFWVRRSALLALLLPLRRGGGDFGRFGRYAEAMLHEREFFIRKAIGWILREASKERPQLVYAWLLPRSRRASGVTVREAVKYLPASQRDEVLGRYRAARLAGPASARALR